MSVFKSFPSTPKPPDEVKEAHDRAIDFYVKPAMQELARKYFAGEPLDETERYIVKAAWRYGREQRS